MRIWLPDGAEQRPVPAVLEYHPYRKNDNTSVADAGRHPYFAGHGYASCGSTCAARGDSDGILLDEYLAQEQDDAGRGDRLARRPALVHRLVGMIGSPGAGSRRSRSPPAARRR